VGTPSGGGLERLRRRIEIVLIWDVLLARRYSGEYNKLRVWTKRKKKKPSLNVRCMVSSTSWYH
jgi:hypothetical protein